jgi:hypothetical protein
VDINRDKFMLLGLLLLLLGLQLRFVETFVLTESSTRFLAKRSAQAEPVSSPWKLPMSVAAQSPLPLPRKRIHPPRWLGYALLSVGIVLVLHSLAMKKPGT